MFPPESLASRGMPSYLDGGSVKYHFFQGDGYLEYWAPGTRAGIVE